MIMFDSGVGQPLDLGVTLSDILESSECPFIRGCSMVGRKINPDTGKRDDYNQHVKTKQYIEVNQDPSKSRCLSTVAKDTLLTDELEGRHLNANYRGLTIMECERLQTLPDGYTQGVSSRQRSRMIGNGWTLEVVKHILKGLL
jgi:site-specific DNA-cytosine methylase